ncbi:hypothetical protein CO112_00735 [Candidatus Dojkabacteria bacterium CG_4_9_14_3_um_filter_150_Dojkabacteria_WS6_41_13]|uniref:Uncharacterized protein n=1 Tax=Candidatus Dojkabacteria bacterium CG_4_10_14_0_2_um_filter_Dojkabacteria_WS6_41_15 TaxID=2014249 RepID=A0A2M7W356_9BACT|nr:MAG: hypothetical protein COZ14_04835 [Candidatus Dojkabacteria bacterium CG_4_10_14_3_um_filter_Dojkabacteria_WS6_41_9]PJA15742.1 MAG: hypothetical protein COX64_00300 [Candidatus Dojkabacteria bacterium CG_4_10_14_0_2_um_filter_Dojkabacteria_WS6_41_15]PJB23536.1 MAG: hypothetical protein CO112_00735 [Candidatus Dojkabacteria bacterium CG_4_9_14_3_um_filter_150_Dojkabacteria_WS6_41_13]
MDIKKIPLVIVILIFVAFASIYLLINKGYFVPRQPFANDKVYFDTNSSADSIVGVKKTDYCSYVSEDEITKIVGDAVVSRSRSADKICLYSNFDNVSSKLVIVVTRVVITATKKEAAEELTLWRKDAQGKDSVVSDAVGDVDAAFWSPQLLQLAYVKDKNFVIVSTIVPKLADSETMSVLVAKKVLARL